MLTGWPEASLPATCGSDPIDCALPFGARQGTRLKISLADFATCLTFSIARVVRLFGCDGLAGSTAATGAAGGAAFPVVAAGFATSAGLVASDFGASDLLPSVNAACWAFSAICGCAVCARAG